MAQQKVLCRVTSMVSRGFNHISGLRQRRVAGGAALAITVAILITLGLMPSQAFGQTLLFSDDAERGLMEPYVTNSWTINSAGVSPTTVLAHSGKYSYVSKVAGADTSSYAAFTSGTDPLYFKFWFYVPSSYTLASGSLTRLGGLLQQPGSWATYPVSLVNSSGTFYLQASGKKGTHPVTTNAWHSVEMTYNNAAHTVAINFDGADNDISVTGVSTEAKNNVLIGANVGTGSIYFDDITVSSAASGSQGSGLTVRHAYPGNRIRMKVQTYLWGAASSDQLVASIDGANFAIIANPGPYQEPVLNLTALSAGNHTLQVQLLNSAGTVRSTWSETIAACGCTPLTGLDENNNTVRNGHKVFPITPWFQAGPQTVYWYQQGYINAAGWAAEYSASYNTTSFNTWLHASGSLNCGTTGMTAMGPLNQRMMNTCAASDTVCSAEAAAYGTYASTFKNDSCLLAWTGFDEASVQGWSMTRLQGAMNAVHANDNNHPFLYDDATFPILNLSWYYPNFVADIYSSDNYPTCYGANIQASGKRQWSDWVAMLDREERGNYGLVPNYQVIELYKFMGSFNCSALTGTRIYNESWTAIIHDRKGLSWYDNGSVTGSGYGPVCSSDSATLCFPANPSTHIGKVVSQVARITPDVVLAAPTGRTVTSNMTSNCVASPYTAGQRVDVTVREDSNNIWIFAARITDPLCSASEETAAAINASFTVSGLTGAATAAVFDESRNVSVSGGVLTDSFAPWAVHIYQISKSGPLPPAKVTNTVN